MKEAPKTLRTKDVCEICDLPLSTLTEWISQGLVQPADPGGDGRGHSRKFTLQQVIGLAVACELRRSERGCALSFFQRIIAAFEALPMMGLMKRLHDGRTHFVTVGEDDGRPYPVLQPGKYDWVEVRSIYEAVMARYRKVGGRERK